MGTSSKTATKSGKNEAVSRSNMNSMNVCGVVGMLLVMGFGVAMLLIGQIARNVVLDANACEMTYSLKEKEEIFVTTYYGNMKMYRYHTENKADKQKRLSPQPVLFVPGHRGE
jgi:hypothetical protein